MPHLLGSGEGAAPPSTGGIDDDQDQRKTAKACLDRKPSFTLSIHSNNNLEIPKKSSENPHALATTVPTRVVGCNTADTTPLSGHPNTQSHRQGFNRDKTSLLLLLLLLLLLEEEFLGA